MSTQDKTLPPLPDLPTGAIMNGRTHIDRLESTGLECEAGTLSNCADWHELKHCFEFLAEWVDMAAIAAQAPQAEAPTQAEVDLNEALLEVDYWKRIAAHLAAPVGYKLVPIREAQQAQAPGWQLVPVEPTPEMKKAAVVYGNGNAVYKNVAREALEIEESIYGEVYAAMLAVAPQQGSNT